ncbi:Metallo-hydrolase/oxidoreductase [Choiromyces venosus 120613-1]|uniref:Metallo-hydrolase/oxidoreductase n=1 Tax=Choiromyces venosus 120613-1 TaxID=1336337 RepID=A0A3N4K406_9PEZI|nr:Metallo-hydrolase/oxidoreductase [Choiromyces venosus 120613-1]
MSAKRKLDPTVEDELIDESDHLTFLCLGGGNEVGRSCHILKYKGKTVMLDAGVHPAYEGLAGLPFYDQFDLSTVDVLLISHFHLDHAASLPYVMTKTNFRGRVFMTHPTKAIYKWLIQDSVRVGNVHNSPDNLYTEADHLSSYSRIEAIDYHTTLTHAGISITPYHAGHVLGGAMFFIEIAGLKILFTGDYSREDDRHLVSAEVPHQKPDLLICESTYGTATHMPRLEKEARLTKMTTEILNRGGRVLMPVFALGRAQELLLILDEYWEKHPAYQSYPIYYASNLARKCMDVYRTYINTMNDKIKRAMFEGEGRNPWDFRWVRSLKTIDRFEDVGGCVMLASPGMLQNGVSRELLERWCPDPRNGLVITGYSVEGTMAKQIMNEPTEIPAVVTANRSGSTASRGVDGQVMVPRRCSVEELSFAAHVDYAQNSGFIEEVGAKVVILVHGEQNNMGRLKSALLSKNSDRKDKDKVKIYNPKNCEELRIPFKADKIAKVVGKLAQKPPGTQSLALKEQLLTGVLVQNDFKLSLMTPDDLREYAGLTTTVVSCRQKIPMHAAGVGLVRWSLDNMFGAVVDIPDDDDEEENESSGEGSTDEDNQMSDGEEGDGAKRKSGNTFKIMDTITVRCRKGYVEMEWVGNMLNDGIADATAAVLMGLETSPAAVRHSSSIHSHPSTLSKIPETPPHAHIHHSERIEQVLTFLEAQFGDSVTPLPPGSQPSSSSTTSTPQPKLVELESESESMKEDPDPVQKMRQIVPGVQIKIDTIVANVWFENLEVECRNESLKMRVKTVVERAVETVAPFVDLVGGY